MEEYKVTFKKSDMLSFVTIDAETIFKHIPDWVHYNKSTITITVEFDSRCIIIPAVAWKQGHGVEHVVLEVGKTVSIEIDDYIRLHVTIDEHGIIKFRPETLNSAMLRHERE